MSREMPTANTETYRVTVTTHYPNGRSFSRTYGPYATASAAKSACTRERKVAMNGRNENIVFTTVERAELIWEEVQL